MISTSNFTIFNASAGSGKTFKIAERYLTLLLSSPTIHSFQHILAITFTNKAVGEMKSRILDYLTAFSEGDLELNQDPMLKLIHDNTGLTLDQIQKKSKAILKAILNNYAGFEVSTIDAFTHRIIRTFAKDLGLSMNFDIEMDTQQILELAVDRVIEKAGTDKKLTQILIRFALEKVEDDKSGDVRLDLLEASKLLLNEKDSAYLQQLESFTLQDFHTLKTQLQIEIDSFTQQMVSAGESVLTEIDNKGLSVKDFNRGSIPNFFKKLAEDHPTLKPTGGTNWERDIEDEQTYVKKNTSQGTKAKIFAMKDLIVKQYNFSKSLYSDRKLYIKLKNNLTQLSVLSTINTEMQLIKKEHNIMLISDFNKKISDEIKKQPAPFIFERLGEKFQHYFIDEFQDTSRLQWNNLIPLTENALSSLFENGASGSLTLVGDAKQSIYAWRGGDAHQFIDLSQKHSPFSVLPELEPLHQNYRSYQTIVDFNNRFFSSLSHHFDDTDLQHLFSTENLEQTAQKDQEGYVNLRFLEKDSKAYPEETLKIIHQKKDQGFDLGDICILVRKKDEGIEIATYLNEHDIPLVSSETLLINSDENVQFILFLLKVLNENEDDLSKVKVLDYLARSGANFNTDIFDIYHDVIQKDISSFWTILDDIGYSFDAEHFHTLPFYDAIEYLMRKFQLDQKANAYIQFFLDEVFEFSQQQKGNLNGFLDYWSNTGSSKSIISPESKNAVQIMTVHKSKGLQFPVVIFPYATSEIDKTTLSHLWVKLPKKFNIPFALLTKPGKDIENEAYLDSYQKLVKGLQMENINVLYVALTRAISELFIISKDDRNKDGYLKDNTYAGLLMQFVESEGQAIEMNKAYEWGRSNTLIKTEDNTISEHLRILEFHSPSPQLGLKLVTTAGKLWNESQADALQKGNLMHSLLSQLNYKKDIENTLQWHIDNGFLNVNEWKPYKSLLEDLVNHKKLKDYFTEAYDVWTEKDIFFNHKLLRPDRVNLNDNQVVIIDYKTGSASEEHVAQIEEYGQALTSLQYIVKSKLLVYINESIDVEIV